MDSSGWFNTAHSFCHEALSRTIAWRFEVKVSTGDLVIAFFKASRITSDLTSWYCSALQFPIDIGGFLSGKREEGKNLDGQAYRYQHENG